MKVAIRIRIESFRKPIREYFSFHLKRILRKIHEFMDSILESLRISLESVANASEIQSDDTDRSGHFC